MATPVACLKKHNIQGEYLSCFETKETASSPLQDFVDDHQLLSG
jgi:hypothetical protein